MGRGRRSDGRPQLKHPGHQGDLDPEATDPDRPRSELREIPCEDLVLLTPTDLQILLLALLIHDSGHCFHPGVILSDATASDSRFLSPSPVSFYLAQCAGWRRGCHRDPSRAAIASSRLELCRLPQPRPGREGSAGVHADRYFRRSAVAVISPRPRQENGALRTSRLFSWPTRNRVDIAGTPVRKRSKDPLTTKMTSSHRPCARPGRSGRSPTFQPRLLKAPEQTRISGVGKNICSLDAMLNGRRVRHAGNHPSISSP